MTEEIREARLENGLMVLLKPVRTAPVATFWVWYRVGSRNEVSGITGVSHWVEHMMFKGTPSIGKGQIMHLINRNGGVDNAFTSTDFTAYFETLPADRIDLSLRIESDRMVNSLFDPEEVASERTVIISEREGSENDPQFWLAEEVQAAAFKVHPYHHDTVGWKIDLETMSRNDLYEHYKTYYVPNDAVVVAAGDFNADEMMRKIKDSFGGIARGTEIPQVKSIEPPQEGERRVLVRRPGPTSYFHALYHAPAASDPDFFPVFVLAGVLSGVGAMTFSGPGSPGRSSRLYRALVEKELAASVECGYRITVDPGAIDVSATVRPGVPVDKVEKVVFAELEKIAAKPITDEEFEKVMKQTRSQFVYATDGVMNVGYWLGQMEVVASYKMYDAFLEQLARVTKEDIQRVAAKYFSITNRTVGWFIPSDGNAPARPVARRTPKTVRAAKKRSRR